MLAKAGIVVIGLIISGSGMLLFVTAGEPGAGAELGWIAFGMLAAGIIVSILPFTIRSRARLQRSKLWK